MLQYSVLNSYVPHTALTHEFQSCFNIYLFTNSSKIRQVEWRLEGAWTGATGSNTSAGHSPGTHSVVLSHCAKHCVAKLLPLQQAGSNITGHLHKPTVI